MTIFLVFGRHSASTVFLLGKRQTMILKKHENSFPHDVKIRPLVQKRSCARSWQIVKMSFAILLIIYLPFRTLSRLKQENTQILFQCDLTNFFLMNLNQWMTYEINFFYSCNRSQFNAIFCQVVFFSVNFQNSGSLNFLEKNLFWHGGGK